MRLSALAVVLALSVPTAALAQPGATPTEAPASARSGGTATVLAVGATVLGFGLIAAGNANGNPIDGGNAVLTGGGYALAAIGPSAGHIYAGEGGHALGFSALRVASLGAVAYGASQAIPCLTETCHDQNPELGAAFMIGGGLVYGGLTIYDIYDAHRAARRERAPAVTVAPTALRTPAGRTATGLVVAGTF